MSGGIRLCRSLALAALLAGAGAQAQAQTFVVPICRGYLSPAPVRFDTPEHARWYDRFWTGRCDHLLACIPGRPNWSEIVTQLLRQGAPGERSAIQAKACGLGQRIGLEWSRERDVRRISTADLRRYSVTVQQDRDPLHGLEAVARAVDAALERASAH
jgi:hypothetical protein